MTLDGKNWNAMELSLSDDIVYGARTCFHPGSHKYTALGPSATERFIAVSVNVNLHGLTVQIFQSQLRYRKTVGRCLMTTSRHRFEYSESCLIG
jgi:hypothetical protein